MRQSHEKAAVDQWRNYLDPSAIIARDLGYQRVDDDMRCSVTFIKFMAPFEALRFSATRMVKAGAPFSVALRALGLPPERFSK